MANLSFQGQGTIKTGTVSVNPASIATLAVGEVTLTISGAVVGDKVVMNPPAAGLTAGVFYTGDARVSAADTVKIRIYNSTGGSVDEAAATWDYCLIRA
jgi:hypothetical protein